MDRADALEFATSIVVSSFAYSIYIMGKVCIPVSRDTSHELSMRAGVISPEHPLGKNDDPQCVPAT